jgi:hypothetical protein
MRSLATRLRFGTVSFNSHILSCARAAAGSVARIEAIGENSSGLRVSASTHTNRAVRYEPASNAAWLHPARVEMFLYCL